MFDLLLLPLLSCTSCSFLCMYQFVIPSSVQPVAGFRSFLTNFALGFQVFENYQQARTTFVQTIAELAHRPQNIEVRNYRDPVKL